ncbi:DinB family protein [Streptomyces pseudogriseolus]|uniref:DinB family protein n=1 Tax=Streptomyces pseudogriseolus TaxID=36817 RepID=UPI001CE2A40D|nr:DinB family protein [Streptomyces pseudogriseolus]
MTTLADAAKADLHRYLQEARDALLWKLEGLSEYDVRRPLTPTGTNLLGLVKHAAGVELGYLGDTFGRPSGEPLPWLAEGAEVNADMWAGPDETRADIVALYRRAWAHADATIEALPLDATGTVPWWPEDRARLTLHHAVVRVIADTGRHAGHADILREHLDGATGERPGATSLPAADPAWWAAYRARLERAAREAAEREGDTGPRGGRPGGGGPDDGTGSGRRTAP